MYIRETMMIINW